MNKMGLMTYSIFMLFIAVASNAGADSTSASARGPAPVRYTGPIIDVHLHTDPPASVIGVPNPVTHARPATSPAELLDATLRACEQYHIVRA
ncbi:MAG TPA: hypothetical protein VFM15_05485, partial [Gammaproteobacteria bacterium]|nr:hypothetical protein [Gammaproteobacteria bacterium]